MRNGAVTTSRAYTDVMQRAGKRATYTVMPSNPATASNETDL